MRKLGGLIAILALSGHSPALAQSAWIAARTGTPGASVAAAAWADGTRIIARCDNGVLTSFLHNPTPFSGAVVYVLTERSGDVSPRSNWSLTSQDSLNIFARRPAEFMRDLRPAGLLKVTIKSRDAADREMSLDMPADTTALDTVMTDCGVAFETPPALERPGPTQSTSPERPGPNWSTPPQPLATDYPAAALRRGMSGQALVSCAASAEGKPENCFAADEAPAGQGFGSAAVAVVMRGRLDMSGQTLEGGNGYVFFVKVPWILNGKSPPGLPFDERISRETAGMFAGRPVLQSD